MDHISPGNIVQEFLIAIDMSINGSPEEKLRWGFRIFDKDGSGEDHRTNYLFHIKVTTNC